MGDERQERRQYPRAIAGGIYEVSLLNVSLAGALLEHVDPLRPGAILSLGFDLQGVRINANCRVVRSEVHGTAMQPDGEQALIYHTGVEFLNPSKETRQAVSEYIQSIIEDGSEKRPREEEVRQHLLRELEELAGRVSGARRVLDEGTTLRTVGDI